MVARTFRILSLALQKKCFSVNELASAARVGDNEVLAILQEYTTFFELTTPPPGHSSEKCCETEGCYRLAPDAEKRLEGVVQGLVPDAFKNEFSSYGAARGPWRERTPLAAAESALHDVLEAWDKLPQQVREIWSRLNEFAEYLREAPGQGHQPPPEWVEDAISILNRARSIQHSVAGTRLLGVAPVAIGRDDTKVDYVSKHQWDALGYSLQSALEQHRSPFHKRIIVGCSSVVRRCLRLTPVRPMKLAWGPILLADSRRLFSSKLLVFKRTRRINIKNGLLIFIYGALFIGLIFGYRRMTAVRAELFRSKELVAQYEIELIRAQLDRRGAARRAATYGGAAALSNCPDRLASPKARDEDKFQKPLPTRVKNPTSAEAYGEVVFEAPKAGEKVLAAENGVVAYVRQDEGKHNGVVLIRHADGYVTGYVNTGEIRVQDCQSVSRGDPIAVAEDRGNSQGKQTSFRFVVRKDSLPTKIDLAENRE